jgi:hypothetical protein
LNEPEDFDRRRSRFTPEEVEEIANAAAERVLDKVYAEVGKSIIKRLAWIAGAALIGVFMWLSSKGDIPK